MLVSYKFGEKCNSKSHTINQSKNRRFKTRKTDDFENRKKETIFKLSIEKLEAMIKMTKIDQNVQK